MPRTDSLNRKNLIKKALFLVWTGELWNVVEAVIR